jgi:hypothetical protein
VPCPNITFTVGSPTTPALRGGTAVAAVDPLTGNFGLTGSVVLRCGQTTFPVTNVTWAALSVSFLVPSSLPDCAAGYQAVFTIGPDTCAVPITITGPIVQPPIAIANPQPVVCVSEARLDLVGVGFGTRPVARMPELDPFYQQLNTYRGATDVAFGTDMATIRALQTHPGYQTNALFMTATLVAVNRDGAAERTSPPVLLSIGLPAPYADVATAAGRDLYFGHVIGRSDLPRVGNTEWLGGPERGEVRLYAANPSAQLAALLPQIQSLVAVRAPRVDPASPLGQSLRAIREAGANLPTPYWREEGVLATLPASDTGGFVIIWRDDIPSAVQPIVRVPWLDCARVGEFVAQGWKLVVNGRDYALDIDAGNLLPIRPEEFVAFQVQRIAGVANPLTQLLDTAAGTAGIVFGFLASASGFTTDRADFHVTEGALTIGTDLVPSDRARVLFHPDIVSEDTSATGVGFKTWEIALVARVTVPSCGTVQLNLVRIRLRQAPLVVPRVAILFEHIDFGGDPLVVVDTGGVIPLTPALVDGRSLSAARITLGVVLTFLDTLGAALMILSVFSGFPGPLRRFPSAGHVQALRDVVAALRSASDVVRPAVDARGVTIELGDVVRKPGGWFGIGEEDFGRVLSSALILGLPNFRGLRMVMEGGWFGNDISAFLRVPGGTVIATVTDFRGIFRVDEAGNFVHMFWPTNTVDAIGPSNHMVVITGAGPWCHDLIDRIEL